MARIPVLIVLLAAAVAACSGGGGGGADPGPPDIAADLPADLPADLSPDQSPDSGPDPAPDPSSDSPPESDSPPDSGPGPGPGPAAEFAGRVHLVERYSPGFGPTSSHVDVLFRDAPDPAAHELIAESGPCRYYRVLALDNCDPPCEVEQRCLPGGTCAPWPERLSAGPVTVTGLKAAVTATPDDTAWYSVVPDPPADMFGAGAAISVAAAGDAVPAFEAHVAGVADMEPGWPGTLQMEDGKPLPIAWPVKGDGARVEVAIQIGWHGKPPTDIIWCEADEASGGVEVPAAFVGMFPPWGGIGLFQNPSWARRVSRTVVDGPHGPVEVMVASETSISFLH